MPLTFDLHLDLAMNAIQYNRDLRLSVAESRRSEAGIEGKSRGRNTVTFPEMRRGQVGLCVATVLARVHRGEGRPDGGAGVTGNRTHETAYAVAKGMLAYYRLLEQMGELRQIRTGAEMTAAAGAWEVTRSPARGRGRSPRKKLAAGDRREAADRVRAGDGGGGLHRHAVAAGGLVGGRAAGRQPRPLRGLQVRPRDGDGRAPLGGRARPPGGDGRGGGHPGRHPPERHLLLGVAGALQGPRLRLAPELPGPGAGGPAVERRAAQGPRRAGRRDRRGAGQLDALPRLRAPGDAARADPPQRLRRPHRPPLPARRVGPPRGDRLDLDGGYGTEQTPLELETIADLQRVPEMLRRRGYSEEDVRAIMGGNAVRFFAAALPQS